MVEQYKKCQIKGEVITKYSAVLFNLFLSDKQKSSRHPLGIVLLQILGNYLSLAQCWLDCFLALQLLHCKNPGLKENLNEQLDIEIPLEKHKSSGYD